MVDDAQIASFMESLNAPYNATSVRFPSLKRDDLKVSRLREAMRQEGFDALVLRLPENVAYLSGAWCGRGLSYLVFPLEKDPILIHPAGESLPSTWVRDVRFYKWESFQHLGSSLELGARHVRSALSDVGLQSGVVGVEEGWELVLSSSLRYETNIIGEKTFTFLRQKLNPLILRNSSQLITKARSIKTPQEVEMLRKANRVARVGLQTFHDNLKIGLREVELSTKIEQAIVREGVLKYRANRVTACAFLASGRNTAYAYKYAPYNGRRKLHRGDLVMLELDVVADGYSSDTTRTFVVGKPSKKQRSHLEAVLDSESAAISSIRAGVRAAEIAKISIGIIQKRGLAAYLVHRLGHGIGVGIHEPIPALHIESEDILLPGMVHSVEPGIYGSKIGGIRIEDDILDTERGAEYLSDFPRIED
jgi:Xaa-Pro dipeptidase